MFNLVFRLFSVLFTLIASIAIAEPALVCLKKYIETPGPSVDDKILLHILGDRFGKATSLEGGDPLVFLQYRLQLVERQLASLDDTQNAGWAAEICAFLLQLVGLQEATWVDNEHFDKEGEDCFADVINHGDESNVDWKVELRTFLHLIKRKLEQAVFGSARLFL